MEGLIYLDNAATAYPKPERVYDFMYEFYKKYGVNPGRSGYDMCMATEEIIHATRTMLAHFFNGSDPNRLTFSYNATDSLNMIIQGMLEKGDHVVTTHVEHNSVLRPINHLERDGGVEVTRVPFNGNGHVEPDNIKKAIKTNTKMVVVNHGSNVIGTVQPIAEIGRVCKEKGVYFAVDTSQTAGVQRIDVEEMNIDLLAFTGHKGMMGPTGIGGSYIRDDVPIRGTRFGGTGVRSAYPFHLEEFPYRMEGGTLNIIGVAGLNAGQKWIQEQGVEKIHEHEMKLWDRLRLALQEIDGVETYCADTAEDHIAVLSFNIDGIDAGNVGIMLDGDHNIACRTGLQCAPLVHEQLGTDKLHGTVRFGIGPFNTDEHIDAAIEAVREISKMRKKVKHDR